MVSADLTRSPDAKPGSALHSGHGTLLIRLVSLPFWDDLNAWQVSRRRNREIEQKKLNVIAEALAALVTSPRRQ